jgi:VCBS repeat-containing protein
VTVNVVGDMRYEGNEVFLVSLSNPTGATLSGAGPGTGTTQNDDVAGTPVAQNDTFDVSHEGTSSISGPGVLTNDSDPDGLYLTAVLDSGPSHTATLVTGPSHGTLTLNGDGSFSYVPNSHYVGSDTFTYTAGDGLATSGAATVSITVTNQSPVGGADSYGTQSGTAFHVLTAAGVLANDTDGEGDPLTASLVSGPSSGQLTLNADGSFSYTPNTGFTGVDSFTYSPGDGIGSGSAVTVSWGLEPYRKGPSLPWLDRR